MKGNIATILQSSTFVNHHSLVAVVGPTATGKTALAIQLAQKYHGEIVCADSRTIYRGLDIGTAKPTVEEQQGIRHYGLDLVEPDERFSAADFQKLARGWIAEIRSRSKLPIIVGGTGLYIDGLVFDYQFGAPADPDIRSELEAMSLEQLQAKINSSGIEMPENSKNKRYLIRSIEQGGVNRTKTELPANTLMIGLDPGQEIIDERITKRIQIMVADGLVTEAKNLFAKYGYDAPAAAAPAYKALRPYFESGADLDDCLEQFRLNDRRLAKRQRVWFRRNPSIHWFADAPAVNIL